MARAERVNLEKRRRILDAAASLFAAHGYAATTLTMIAHAADTVVGSVTHFCGGKPDIAAAVHETLAGSLVADLLDALDPTVRLGPTAWVRPAIEAVQRWVTAHPGGLALLQLLEAELRQRSEDRFRPLEQRLADLLAARTQPIDGLDGPLRYAVALAPVLAHASVRANRPLTPETARTASDLFCAVATAGFSRRGPKTKRTERTSAPKTELFSDQQ